MAGIGQTIPNEPGTEIALESTGNGLGNLFHSMWVDAVRGESDYLPVFIPWFWQSEYKLIPSAGWRPDSDGIEYMELYGIGLEQAYWRERKIKTDFRGETSLFDQEYPACVTGDTRVGTDLGLIPIREAVKAQVSTKGVIAATHPHDASAIFKLTTEMGYEVCGTFDHPIFSSGGVLIPLAACQGHEIQLCPPMLASQYYKSEWVDCGVGSSITFDEKWGRLLGFYMGDGSLYESCLSTVCDAGDADVVQDVVGLYKDVFGLEATTRTVGSKRGGTEVQAYNKKLIELFDRFNLIHRNGSGGMCRRVHVPEAIFRSPKSVAKEFLRGLFESDGFAGYDFPRVVLFSKYKDFLRDVQLLLLAFGITCKLTSNPRHNHRANGERYEYIANELTLRREEAVLFGEEIGFVSARKNKRVVDWKETSKAGRSRQPLVMRDMAVSVVADGFEETFDLTVSGGESFDANGIHTHNTAELAFRRQSLDTLLKIAVVERAMRRTDLEAVGPRIMGIDPSESESEAADDTVFCLRQGRVVHEFRRFHGRKTTEVVALAARAIHDWDPDYINVDAGGLGSGIADRLIELGYPVSRILFGERAVEIDLYGLRRDEMWGEMAEWFKDPVQLPYDMAALADLTAPAKDEDGSLRFKLETKKSMKKRGLKSPDAGDSLALTFALPVTTSTPKRPNRNMETTNWRVL
jgi:hypothetical protein